MARTARHKRVAPPHSRMTHALARFSRDEDGNIAVFSIFMIIMMLMVGGVAVDLMRFEMNRAKLQATLDSAVLAAADLGQTMDPKGVVEDYFEKSGLSDYLDPIIDNSDDLGADDIDDFLNMKRVYASATMEVPTPFLKLSGYDSLTLKANAEAIEEIEDVEISLVLDISGSMDYDGKMGKLKSAAKGFIDDVLNDSTTDRISVSLVPYSEQVNAGAKLFNELKTYKRHDYSHCIEIPQSEFGPAAPADGSVPVGTSSYTKLNRGLTYEQVQHFQYNYASSNTVTDTICPRYSYEEITPFSQNASALKSQIDSLQPRAGTAIYMGMKWAAALLDPDFNTITQKLATTTTETTRDCSKYYYDWWGRKRYYCENVTVTVPASVDAVFNDRPAAFDDRETMKTVVLMTDGVHSNSTRIQSWAYDSDDEIRQWDRYNASWYRSNYMSGWQYSNFYETVMTPLDGERLLTNICSAAKQNGITIWSIQFEVSQEDQLHAGITGKTALEKCASSPSHFFAPSSTEINSAFKSIARQINQLRLTR